MEGKYIFIRAEISDVDTQKHMSPHSKNYLEIVGGLAYLPPEFLETQSDPEPWTEDNYMELKRKDGVIQYAHLIIDDEDELEGENIKELNCIYDSLESEESVVFPYAELGLPMQPKIPQIDFSNNSYMNKLLQSLQLHNWVTYYNSNNRIMVSNCNGSLRVNLEFRD